MSKPEVAFLGPEGTYSHQAAHELFADAALYLPRRTIAETFSALESVPFALLPWENSIHGIVLDTLDLLRGTDVGTRLKVRGETVVAVKHCLLVKKSVQLAHVKRVMSHEQAIGQCTNFLREYLPQAALLRVASTAKAAELVASGDGNLESAAICSSICATLFPGLEVAREGIQDADDNFTRFVLLSSSDILIPPSISLTPQTIRHALIRASIPPSVPTLLGPLLTALASLSSPLSVFRVDRRPSLSATPFHDLYFFELQAQGPLHGTFDEEVEDTLGRMRSVLGTASDVGGEATLLGVW